MNKPSLATEGVKMVENREADPSEATLDQPVNLAENHRLKSESSPN